MKFTKMQGAGNDFIVLDNRSGEIRENEYSALAVRLCRRRLSIGADGLMIEVHNDPEHALCDGQPSIKPQVFDSVMRDIRLIAAAVGRSL